MTTQTKETTTDNFKEFELINEKNYFKWCIFDKDNKGRSDTISRKGTVLFSSAYQKRSISIREYLDNNKNCILTTNSMALKMQREFDKIKYDLYKPVSIPKQNFLEMLGCMPPEKWETSEDNFIIFESFKMAEALTNHIYTFYCRVKKPNYKNSRYLKVNLHGSCNHHQIRNFIIEHINKKDLLANTK